MIQNTKILAQLLAGAAAVASLHAETIQLGRSVVSATGFEQDLRDAPASVSMVEGDELSTRPVRDLAEAVSQLPGVSIESGVTDFGTTSISIRGMPANYTLLLIDGKRQDTNSLVYPNSGFAQSTFMPPIAAIERIEVIRGPASIIYGNDAMGGVVNVILKKSFDKWTSNATASTTIQENSLFGNNIGLSAFTAGPLTPDKRWSLQLRASELYTAPQRGDLTLTLPARGAGDNPLVPSAAASNGTQTFSQILGGGKNHNYAAGGRIGFAKDESNAYSVDLQHGGQWYDPAAFENSYFIRNNFIARHEGTYRDWLTDSSLQYNTARNFSRSRNGRDIIAEHKSSIAFWRMKLNVGGQYDYSEVKAVHGTTFSSEIGSAIHRHTYALYAEDEWAILDSLLFNFGVRANANSDFDLNFSPRAYLVGYLSDSLTLKGGVSTGYKLPEITSTLPGWISSSGGGNSGGSAHGFGNPDLKPETSISYEISLMHETPYTDISLTGFLQDFKDKIASASVSMGAQGQVGTAMAAGQTCDYFLTTLGTPGTSCSYSYNVDSARSYGIELAAALKAIDTGAGRVGVNLAYTWLKNEITSGVDKGLPLTGVPEHTLNAGLNYGYGDFGASLRGEFRARQLRTQIGGRAGSTAGDTTILEEFQRVNPGVSEYYEPYFLLHLSANYHFTPTLRANFGIYNLLNHDFVDYVPVTNIAASGAQYSYTNTYTNNYNYIREGRRYYLSISADF